MKSAILTLLLVGCSSAGTFAQSNSSSANVDLLHAPLAGGGGQISNGSNITMESSVGVGVEGGVSLVTSGGVQANPNYVGQLYDVESLEPAASPDTVDEGSTRQLGAVATMDDLTEVILDGSDVAWSVLLGPLSGIDSAGLATAEVVLADAEATAEGTYLGVSGQIILTVLNSDPDNFGSYGGDGLPDDWQVNYFGNPPNADADPEANSDQDPYDNYFEFLTGYDPTDPADHFTFGVVAYAGSNATIELSKIVPGTRYRLERRSTLAPGMGWGEFTNFTTVSEVLDHQVDDVGVSGDHRFYRVGVEPE